MAIKADSFIQELASQNRVLVIGGLAVIGHGYSRPTKDADIWLEPMTNAQEWVHLIERHCKKFAGLTTHTLPGWVQESGTQLIEAVEQTGLIRILGLDCPLDIFRQPNEFEIQDFEDVFSEARQLADGTYLPTALDLIQSKQDTNRDKDHQDILFLESILRKDYLAQLPTCDLSTANALLDRYADPEVLKSALSNPDPNIQTLATRYLKEFAEAGDPFSLAILEDRELP